MRHSNQGRIQRQVSFLRRQFLQDGDLPFTDVLSAEVVSQALTEIGTCWNDRIFTPLVTLWVFSGKFSRRPFLPCRGGSINRPSRLAGSQTVQL